MAKILEISPDAGANWYGLPGSTANLNLNGENIDDTILGQTFQSGQPGLINWGMDSNALYKGYPGYTSTLKKQGTATSATGEAMTVVSGKTYAIDAVAKNMWDRSVAAVVYDGAVDKTDEVESINYLFGEVTFKSTYTVTGAVTVDVDYFPTAVLARTNSYSLGMTMTPIDASDFAGVVANSGYNIFQAGLRAVTLELTGIYDSAYNVKTVLQGRDELVIELDPVGTSKSFMRGFFKVLTDSQGGDVGALEEETISLTHFVPSDPLIDVVLAWKHDNNSDIPVALKHVLSAWENETSLLARYLPSGAIGQTPLDGVQGTVWVADVSLSSGMSDMNTFNVTLQGSDGFTEV